VKDSVCAVVVTYNRKHLLIECLEALLNQARPIQAICLIDNLSTDGTPELLSAKGYIGDLLPVDLLEPFEQKCEVNNSADGKPVEIYYVRMHENVGGAGGFHEGLKRAYERGFDWFWLMDDDAEPTQGSLAKLQEHFGANDIAALACSVLSDDGRIAYHHRGLIDLRRVFPLLQKPLLQESYTSSVVKIDMASFVGLLVGREAVSRIGYPKKEFFIHHDDVEYSMRLRKAGEMLLVPGSRMIHKEAAQCIQKRFFGMDVARIPFNRFWLTYYGMRNLVWLGNRYSKNRVGFYSGWTIKLLRTITGILLLDDNKFQRIRLVVQAYRDGLGDTFDNDKPRKYSFL